MIPMVIEEGPEGGRAFDIFSRLLNERVVWLGEEVDSRSAGLVVAQLLYLAYQNPKADIKLYINSPGGSVYDGLAIYDTIQYIQPDVQTIGVGLSASMGALLLSSGAKGKRFMLPHARAMIHQPSSGTTGKVTDQEIMLREAVELKGRLNEILAANTGQTVKKIAADVERDFWLSASDAKKYGLVDSILERA
ncbi:ATP-dependent Clp protease proteolytic subunit [Candidatus Saccharibacteria bacterium]|nr:ATP-dependent Clp protease proteolytic subunit [Candidatus Saccharibacteria bacterium]